MNMEKQNMNKLMNLTALSYSLKDLGRINVIMGKNGCGKSVLLRHFDLNIDKIVPKIASIKYISPERGGKLNVDPNVVSNLQHDSWLGNVLRRNRVDNFRQISATNFDNLERVILRKIEKDNKNGVISKFCFDEILTKLNKLLDNIKLIRTGSGGFVVQQKISDNLRDDVESLSSGECELVSLAIEILHFVHTIDEEKINVLLMDEPDVHLHPDLQYRLMNLLVESAKDKSSIVIIIATHSTAILGTLNEVPEAKVSFMKSGDKTLLFSLIDETLKDIIPIFGAHPLSNIFNQKSILLVEGEDEVRIWQQAVRSSKGKIEIWPCSVDGITRMEIYENKADEIIGSVYDNAQAYSLRDLDGKLNGELVDKSHVIRCRLNCYSSENLILSNEVLHSLGFDWEEMKSSLNDWLISNTENKMHLEMKKFITGGPDRKNHKVKSLRNIFMALLGSNKPWEVVVGLAISELNNQSNTEEGSLKDFLSDKLVKNLSLCADPCASSGT